MNPDSCRELDRDRDRTEEPEKSNIESSSCIHKTSQLEVNEFKENFSHPMQINIPLGISIPQNKQKHIVKKKFVNYLFLSRIHPKKQLDLILKTLSIINKRGFYSWTLEIVGDGDKNYLNSKECIKFINESNLTPFANSIDDIDN